MVSNRVRERFLAPQNVGMLANPEAMSKTGSLVCGAVLTVTLRVSEERKIEDARFKVAGCSRLVAACSLMTELAKGMTTADAADTARSTELLNELGQPPEGKEHCVALAGDALLTAIRSYSNSVRDEWSGDDALICTCFGVSEQTISKDVQRGGLKTIGEVTAASKAGAGCGSCHSLIQDMLDNEISD